MAEYHGNTEIRMGSDKSFGFVFAMVFLIISMFPTLWGNGLRFWALGVAGSFMLVALLSPHWLRPLNRLWFRFGLLLSRIVSPVVMALIYVLTVVPVGLIMRLVRRDPLRTRFDPDVESYWIPVDPAARASASMRHQF